MLEGLFISVLSIICNGKLHLQHAMKPEQLALCANLRRGHLTSPKLLNVATHLQPLIIGLHNLFYPLNTIQNDDEEDDLDGFKETVGDTP